MLDLVFSRLNSPSGYSILEFSDANKLSFPGLGVIGASVLCMVFCEERLDKSRKVMEFGKETMFLPSGRNIAKQVVENTQELIHGTDCETILESIV